MKAEADDSWLEFVGRILPITDAPALNYKFDRDFHRDSSRLYPIDP